MKTNLVILVLAILLPAAAIQGAQAGAEHGSEHEAGKGEHHDNTTFWKTLNFLILAGVIGYGVAKVGPAFFRSRTQEIQQGIAEATKLRQDAEARAADMERRLQSLSQEIADIRSSARAELEAEDRRVQAETERLISRLQANAEQEIASAAKQARKELRSFSAELALELARKKIKDRMTPDLSNNLIDTFVQDLGRVPHRVK